MTLQQLRYLLAVQQNGGFVKAAEACNVSQPSLSVQIQNLEEELKVKLFDRSVSRGLVVTEAGELVLKQARVILQEVDRLYDMSQSEVDRYSGQCKLGLIPTVAPFLIPQFAGSMLKKYPEIEISIYEEPTTLLVEKITAGLIDAAILSTPSETPSGLVERTLYYEPFFVFASPKHHLLAKDKVKADQLMSESPILLDDAHCLRDQVEGLCMSQKKSQQKLNLATGNLNTLITLVNSQESFTLLPVLALDLLTNSQKQNQVREIVSPQPHRKVSLVYHQSFARKKLIDILVKEITSQLPAGVTPRLTKRQEAVSPLPSRF